MAKTFNYDGEVVPVVAPANVSAGDPVLVGTLFGVALHDALQNATVEIATEGVWTLPKAQPLVLVQGARVFWNGTAVDDTVLAQVCVGNTVEADAAGTATEINVLLRGSTAAGL